MAVGGPVEALVRWLCFVYGGFRGRERYGCIDRPIAAKPIPIRATNFFLLVFCGNAARLDSEQCTMMVVNLLFAPDFDFLHCVPVVRCIC